jgi:hypothetical protein
MRGNILEEMLLIHEPSVLKLYKEMMEYSGYFIAPVFTIALLIEYFGEMDFGGVVRKLLIITLFMGSFYQFHTSAVKLSLETASQTLNKVSPKNLFVKKWFHVKVRTQEQKQWNFLESFAIPNINDLVATSFFLLASVFIWLLKLIYSSVYHLTYIFSGITAILYFLGWTKDAIKGTFQASLWCMFLPFVIVAILAFVGNSIEETASTGGLVVAKIDTIIWLFGVTLLLLISPLITFGMIKGDGIHSFGSKMGSMIVSSGLKAAALAPVSASKMQRMTNTVVRSGRNTFFEPSLKDILRKENTPDTTKSMLLEKRGAFKSPFSDGRTLEERLKEVGMEKSEAMSLSKISDATPRNRGSKFPSSSSQNQFMKKDNAPLRFNTKSSADTTLKNQPTIKRYDSDLNDSSRIKSKNHRPLKENNILRTRQNQSSVSVSQKKMKKDEKIAPRREKHERLRGF